MAEFGPEADLGRWLYACGVQRPLNTNSTESKANSLAVAAPDIAFGANAMLRVRLKADGRLVEVLPDGSERASSPDAQSIARAAHDAARLAARSSDARFQDATYARSVRGRTTGLTQAAFAARLYIGVPVEDGAELGASGQALAARSGPRAAQGHRTGARRRVCRAQRQGELTVFP